jgi:hypothetical protein
MGERLKAVKIAYQVAALFVSFKIPTTIMTIIKGNVRCT